MSVALVGLWLAAIGVADLGRTSTIQIVLSRQLLRPLVGASVLILGLLTLEMDKSDRGWLAVALSLLLTGWLLIRRPALSFGCLTVGGVVALLSARTITTERQWPAWLEPTVLGSYSISTVLVTFGVLVAQLYTANVVVRMFLDAVGVPATTNEKQLQGGRFLGPMERVLLVCLGALGEVTAASLVIAAKGLLRFPEIQRAHRETPVEGPSDVTEYFLIGSLASWLLALGGAGLIHLAR